MISCLYRRITNIGVAYIQVLLYMLVDSNDACMHVVYMSRIFLGHIWFVKATGVNPPNKGSYFLHISYYYKSWDLGTAKHDWLTYFIHPITQPTLPNKLPWCILVNIWCRRSTLAAARLWTPLPFNPLFSVKLTPFHVKRKCQLQS